MSDGQPKRSWWQRLPSPSGSEHAAARKLAERAERDMSDGRADKALRRLRKARKKAPDDPDIALVAGDIAFEAGAFDEAAEAFTRAAELLPDEAYPRALLGAVQLELGALEDASATLAAARELNPGSPDAAYWQAVLHDIEGDDRRSMEGYRRAARLAPRDYFVPCRVPRKRFLRLAEKALRELDRTYEGFADALTERNVDLRVQDVPPRDEVESGEANPLWLGMFRGHMGPEVSLEDPWSALPAHIVLYQRNIERECVDEDELYEQVRITLLHEAAHAHGREEDWMDERGLL